MNRPGDGGKSKEERNEQVKEGRPTEPVRKKLSSAAWKSAAGRA
ncbi:MAG: hypothetical protein ACLRSW_15415 [Christensenellaceae bacterium]